VDFKGPLGERKLLLRRRCFGAVLWIEKHAVVRQKHQVVTPVTREVHDLDFTWFEIPRFTTTEDA
jgi:hypothetical protein